MIYQNILEAIGHTPIIQLNHMTGPDDARVLVKFEGLNVGGSVKTRTAYNMICEAEARGILKADSVIVEPTSGNQGIGLALVGAVKGYKTVIIMPDSVSHERKLLVEHYGAEVILIHDAGNIGDCIDECQKLAEKMARENPKVFVPQQFENPANPMVHRHHTGLEILEQVAGHRRDYHRNRRNFKGFKSADSDLGCGAGERGDSCRGNRWDTHSDGNRRRSGPESSESGDL